MSYHVETSRFRELPSKIIVRDDGYMSSYKNDGEPIVDYIYQLVEVKRKDGGDD